MPRRSTSVLVLVIASVVVALGVAVMSFTAPAGAEDPPTSSSSSSSSSSTSSSSTTTTIAPTTTTAAPTTSTTAEAQTTTTQRSTATTQRSTTTSSSTSTSTSSTSTTIAPAVVPPGYSDPNAKGSSFWTSGRKLGAIVMMLVLLGLAMGALSFLYWRATRPMSGDGSRDDASGRDGGVTTGSSTGPVGPLDPMVAEALRPDAFVTRDDLGLA